MQAAGRGNHAAGNLRAAEQSAGSLPRGAGSERGNDLTECVLRKAGSLESQGFRLFSGEGLWDGIVQPPAPPAGATRPSRGNPHGIPLKDRLTFRGPRGAVFCAGLFRAVAQPQLPVVILLQDQPGVAEHAVDLPLQRLHVILRGVAARGRGEGVGGGVIAAGLR